MTTTIKSWQRWSLNVGLVAAAFCVLDIVLSGPLLFHSNTQFFHSYLLAVVTWLGIALGSLALLMLHHLTGGVWGLVIRRLLEAATRTLPLMALLFLPLAVGLADIYPWARPQEHHEMSHRAHYLNTTFFLVRAGTYFAVWLVMVFLLNRWSIAADAAAGSTATQSAQIFSGPGLVLYGLTMTFAAIDWVMSLDPHWSSTIFGPVIVTGQMLPALALAIALATCLAKANSPLAEVATPAVWNDLGNLLLAFVMLWTYMAFSQFLLIWSTNLPEEISWYEAREKGGWQWIGVALGAFYFALPFLLLLSRAIKRDPVRLRGVAVAVVAMSVVHHFWLIAPAFSPGQFSLHWMDIAAMVAVGGFWLAYFLRQVQARPLLPARDPLVKEALGHA